MINIYSLCSSYTGRFYPRFRDTTAPDPKPPKVPKRNTKNVKSSFLYEKNKNRILLDSSDSKSCIKIGQNENQNRGFLLLFCLVLCGFVLCTRFCFMYTHNTPCYTDKKRTKIIEKITTIFGVHLK